MGACNEDALRIARAKVCERYTATYHRNAILAGDWDKGSLVQTELREALKKRADAPDTEGEGE